MEAGRITARESQDHPNRGALTRFLGNQADIEPDISPAFRLSPGDTVILCSDGLSDVVSDDEIGRSLRRNDPRATVASLIRLANGRGNPDNVTAVVIQASEPPKPAAVAAERRFSSAPPSRALPQLPRPRAGLAAAALLAASTVVVIAGLWLWQANGGGYREAPARTPDGLGVTTASVTPPAVTPAVTPTKTRLPASTPQVSAAPLASTTAMAQALGTVTPISPPRSFPIPVLSSPVDRETFGQRTAKVVLTWLPIQGLGQNELYGVRMALAQGDEYLWTTNSSIEVPAHFYYLGPGNQIFRWAVAVVRCRGGIPACKDTFEPASGWSTEWAFLWNDGAGDAPTLAPRLSTATPVPPASTPRPPPPKPTRRL
jgi:hypothetical protein